MKKFLLPGIIYGTFNASVLVLTAESIFPTSDLFTFGSIGLNLLLYVMLHKWVKMFFFEGQQTFQQIYKNGQLIAFSSCIVSFLLSYSFIKYIDPKVGIFMLSQANEGYIAAVSETGYAPRESDNLSTNAFSSFLAFTHAQLLIYYSFLSMVAAAIFKSKTNPV